MQQQVLLTGVIYIITAYLVPVGAGVYPDADQVDAITANWKCQWCPTIEKPESQGQISAGAGYVTNDSAKHGDYTGLDEKGAYLILDGNYQYRNNEGESATGEVENLGLDSRRVTIEGEKQGSYKLSMDYRELPKLYSDTTGTPYRGDSDLTLTGGGGFGFDTQSMPQLAGELRDINVYTQRKRFSLSGSYNQSSDLSYTVRFKRETKEGTRSAGLALGNTFALTRSAIVAIPVDYVTNEGQFNVNYQRRRWQGGIQYQYATFKNENDSVRWNNIFTEPAGVSEGQASLEPDNTMHQVSLTGLYRVSADTQANALLSAGLMRQDEDFLPYTINGSLSTAPLPRSSLDGEINTYDANFTVVSRLHERSRIKAQFQQHEQDNDTPRATYDYIAADTSVPLIVPARANFPYSFKRQLYSVAADYAIKVQRKLAAGVKLEKFDRTYQEVETTKENTYWFTFKNQVNNSLNYDLQFSIARRERDNYGVVQEIDPPENALMRKYNLADRDRDKAGLRIAYDLSDSTNIGFYTDHASDDYKNSEIGLQESKQASFVIDVHHRISDLLSISLDYTKTNIDSTQAGSQGFTNPDWSAQNKDEIQVSHIGMDYVVKKETLNIVVDYTYAESTGDISVTPGEAFPELTSVRHTFTVHADYIFDKKSVLNLMFRYEDYKEENWSNDKIFVNSIPNVLSTGEISPDYNVGVFAISYKYLFD